MIDRGQRCSGKPDNPTTYSNHWFHFAQYTLFETSLFIACFSLLEAKRLGAIPLCMGTCPLCMGVSSLCNGTCPCLTQLSYCSSCGAPSQWADLDCGDDDHFLPIWPIHPKPPFANYVNKTDVLLLIPSKPVACSQTWYIIDAAGVVLGMMYSMYYAAWKQLWCYCEWIQVYLKWHT